MPEFAETPRKHCFHHDGYGVSTGDTMRWGETCCQCGEKRGMASGSERTDGHGPHVYVKRSVTAVSAPPKSEHCTPVPLPPSPQFTGVITAGVSGRSS